MSEMYPRFPEGPHAAGRAFNDRVKCEVSSESTRRWDVLLSALSRVVGTTKAWLWQLAWGAEPLMLRKLDLENSQLQEELVNALTDFLSNCQLNTRVDDGFSQQNPYHMALVYMPQTIGRIEEFCSLAKRLDSAGYLNSARFATKRALGYSTELFPDAQHTQDTLAYCFHSILAELTLEELHYDVPLDSIETYLVALREYVAAEKASGYYTQNIFEIEKIIQFLLAQLTYTSPRLLLLKEQFYSEIKKLAVSDHSRLIGTQIMDLIGHDLSLS